MIRTIIAALTLAILLLPAAVPSAGHAASPAGTFGSTIEAPYHTGPAADHHGTPHDHRTCDPLSSCTPTVLIGTGTAIHFAVGSRSWPMPVLQALATRLSERDPPVPRPFA